MNKHKPIIGIFRERRDITTFHFKAPQYRRAYEEVIAALEARGAYVAILMGNGTYQGDGVFSRHWVLAPRDNGEYVFEARGQITVDVLWVKDQFDHDDSVLQVNTPEFRRLADDKHASYELLEAFHPTSRLVYTDDELSEAINDTPGRHVAVKMLYGNSGKGVYVGPKHDYDRVREHQEFPLQVQQFVDTHLGIPGIVEGRHDFRVIIINGEAVIATLRTPPAGGLKSNIGYGGETRLIDIEDVPLELRALCRDVDAQLETLGAERFYSADFGRTDTGWVLFEINAMPGTINRDRGLHAAQYQQKLIDFLYQAASRQRRKKP